MSRRVGLDNVIVEVVSSTLMPREDANVLKQLMPPEEAGELKQLKSEDAGELKQLKPLQGADV